jgi:hypothetical protein
MGGGLWYYKLLSVKQNKSNTWVLLTPVLSVSGAGVMTTWPDIKKHHTLCKKNSELDADLNETYSWKIKTGTFMDGFKIIKWDNIHCVHQQVLMDAGI